MRHGRLGDKLVVGFEVLAATGDAVQQRPEVADLKVNGLFRNPRLRGKRQKERMGGGIVGAGRVLHEA